MRNQVNGFLEAVKENSTELQHLVDQKSFLSEELVNSLLQIVTDQKENVAEELKKYLSDLEHSFGNVQLVKELSDTLEFSKGRFLEAIEEIAQEVQIGDKPVIPESIVKVSSDLEHLNFLVKSLKEETKKQIEELTEGTKYVKQVGKTVVPHISRKAQFGLEGFWEWIKIALVSVQEFLVYTEKTLEDFIVHYIEVQKHTTER